MGLDNIHHLINGDETVLLPGCFSLFRLSSESASSDLFTSPAMRVQLNNTSKFCSLQYLRWWFESVLKSRRADRTHFLLSPEQPVCSAPTLKVNFCTFVPIIPITELIPKDG